MKRKKKHFHNAAARSSKSLRGFLFSKQTILVPPIYCLPACHMLQGFAKCLSGVTSSIKIFYINYFLSRIYTVLAVSHNQNPDALKRPIMYFTYSTSIIYYTYIIVNSTKCTFLAFTFFVHFYLSSVSSN